MSVTMRGYVINGVQPSDATTSAETLIEAERLIARLPGENWFMAIVDRHDGLALLCRDPRPDETGPEDIRGCHFQSAVAGYAGAGPITAARILALYGFGSFKKLFRQLIRGGDDAFYGFLKVDDEVIFTRSPGDLLK